MASSKWILSSLGKGPARRNLFGPVDHEQLQQEYQNALRRDLEDACHRWGFDFLSEKPLAGGDFQWEGVLSTKLPLLYQPCLLGQGEAQREGGLVAITGRVRAGPLHHGKENIPCTPEKIRSPMLTRPLLVSVSADFYQAKKRVEGTQCKSGQ
uniref:Cyclin dependent kinase inhibitor 1A n=1 Tax=Oncorhynchus kisutch TaxID=8019 RepID=A0A8C7GV76_ONCKI